MNGFRNLQRNYKIYCFYGKIRKNEKRKIETYSMLDKDCSALKLYFPLPKFSGFVS